VSSTTLVTAVRPTGVPTATWADAPLPAVLNDLHYPGFSRVGHRRQAAALKAEGNALENATVSAFPSQWAADLALDINPRATIRVHPFGPNIDDDLRREVLDRRATKGRNGPLRILFNGVDWRRKGGDIALRVVERVIARTGKDVQLLVLGLDAPRGVSGNAFATFLGRVSKSTHAGRRTWVDAYSAADLFLFPTRSENYGAVVAEAAACGVPVVVSHVGGAWQSVVKGGFGQVVPAFAAEEVDELADAVIRILTDQRHAAELGHAGITAVDEWLNYEHSARSLVRDLETS
jgi:glycosyltransferase involved in cell wall biosynthesis